MPDVPEEFESTDKLGTTSQYDGVVGVAPISIPAIAGNDIGDFIIQCPFDQADTNTLKVSINGGLNFLTMQPAGFWGWTPKGGVKQLVIKGNVAGVKYEVVLNRELS